MLKNLIASIIGLVGSPSGLTFMVMKMVLKGFFFNLNILIIIYQIIFIRIRIETFSFFLPLPFKTLNMSYALWMKNFQISNINFQLINKTV